MQKLTGILSTENRFQLCTVLAKSIRKVHKPNDQMQHTMRTVIEFMHSQRQASVSPGKERGRPAAPFLFGLRGSKSTVLRSSGSGIKL